MRVATSGCEGLPCMCVLAYAPLSSSGSEGMPGSSIYSCGLRSVISRGGLSVRSSHAETCGCAHARLQYRERIIFLGKAIDEELGNQLVATMLYLDSESKKDIQLYINCSGGDVRAHAPPPKCYHIG